MDKIRDNRQYGFFRVDNRIFDEYMPDMGTNALAVYCYFCRLVDNSTLSAFPGVAKIAERLGFSESTAHRAIATLKALGLISVEPQYRKNGSQSSNLYIIECVQTAEIAPPVTHDTPSPVTHDTPPLSPMTPLLTHTDLTHTQSTNTEDSPPAAERQLTPQQAMVGAICEVTHTDYKIRRNAGQAARAAKELLAAGYTADDVRAVFGEGGWWYKEDWRGKQGQLPRIEQIAPDIAKGKESVNVKKDRFAMTDADRRRNEIAFASIGRRDG